MEEKKSLGYIRLSNDGYSEQGELFVSKVFGTVVLSVKRNALFYAASRKDEHTFFISTSDRGFLRFVYYGFDDLKKELLKAE